MSTTELLLPLAGILVGAKLAGMLFQRAGLPAALGKMLLGLLLGPALLGWVALNDSLRFVADLGVLLLMFLAGLETDVAQLRRVGRASFGAALGGVVLPFLGGFALTYAFGHDLTASLFMGTLLTATSVSITAYTLRELGKLQSREGTAILGAAVIDDVLGIIALALVVAASGGGDPGLPILKMLAFFPIAVIFGRLALWLATRLFHGHAQETVLGVLLAILLVYAWVAESFGGVAAITGAYLAGLLVARTAFKERAIEGASLVGYGFFVPVFFVSVGLQVGTEGLWHAPLFGLLLASMAVVTKALGCFGGARLGGMKTGEAVRVGVGMIARGEVALVVAAIGLRSGLIDTTLFSVGVLMTILTTLPTPLLLRATYLRRRSGALPAMADRRLQVVD